MPRRDKPEKCIARNKEKKHTIACIFQYISTQKDRVEHQFYLKPRREVRNLGHHNMKLLVGGYRHVLLYHSVHL